MSRGLSGQLAQDLICHSMFIKCLLITVHSRNGCLVVVERQLQDRAFKWCCEAQIKAAKASGFFQWKVIQVEHS